MPRFTRLEDRDVRELAEGFALGEVRAWREIEAGTINSNHRVETAEGIFFLRVNEGKEEADVRYEAELVEALARAGVPTPRPRRSRAGAPYLAHGSRYVSVFPWVPGEHRQGGALRPLHAEAVGEALAALHEAGRPLAPRFERAGIYTFEDIVRRFETFRDHRDPELAGAIAELAEEVSFLRARRSIRDAAPRGVIHGDLFPDNVLFDERDRVAALLDFEQASAGSPVYDLAVCLNAWCYTDDFEPALARAFARGYRRRRELEESERRALWIEARAAAMRFTVTRITDVYLPGVALPGKDFRRYLARLRRWRELGEETLAAWVS